MGRRIARGALLGIFLGVICGVAISCLIYMKNIVEYNMAGLSTEDSYTYDSTFNEDGIMDEAIDVFGEDAVVATIDEGALTDVVFRFHVRANSNSDEDLELKYKVRDKILEYLDTEAFRKMSRDEVMIYLTQNLNSIEMIARTVIVENGFSYNIDAYISDEYFPIRQYGDMVLPAGQYQALRIDIGEAKGENFWCILYPMMCYSVDTAAVVSKEDGEELARSLSDEEYEKLFIERDVEKQDVKVKFKFLEWLGF